MKKWIKSSSKCFSLWLSSVLLANRSGTNIYTKTPDYQVSSNTQLWLLVTRGPKGSLLLLLIHFFIWAPFFLSTVYNKSLHFCNRSQPLDLLCGIPAQLYWCASILFCLLFQFNWNKTAPFKSKMSAEKKKGTRCDLFRQQGAAMVITAYQWYITPQKGIVILVVVYSYFMQHYLLLFAHDCINTKKASYWFYPCLHYCATEAVPPSCTFLLNATAVIPKQNYQYVSQISPQSKHILLASSV